jgi:hypothetical protein
VKFKLAEILKKVRENLKAGKYIPLPHDESKLVREFYAEQIPIPLDGGDLYFHNENGTLISKGYSRIVLGDYGPFIEVSEDQIILENIKNKWPGKQKKSGMKYIWMETRDKEKTKIYHQLNKVPYADYQPNKYYIDPRLVFYVEPGEWNGK